MEIVRLVAVHFAVGLAVGGGVLLAALIQKGGQAIVRRRREAENLDAARLITYLGALSNRRQWVITKGLATAQNAEPSCTYHHSRLV